MFRFAGGPRVAHLTITAFAAAALAGAPAASADSIVYVKDRNLWIANPDGSGNRQITTDGAEYRSYTDPTQSDDGRIWAGRGSEIVELDQQGTVLAHWDPPATSDSTSNPMDEVPQDLAVSPDGRRLAYTLYRYSCPVAADCTARTTTVFSYADRLTQPSELGYELNLQNAQWISNDRILGFGGAGRMVNFDAPGTGSYDAVHWFDDPDEDVSDGELSPRGDRLATLRSYGSNLHLQLWKVTSTTDAPQRACTAGPDPGLNDPTWSPDGTRLAVQVDEGLQVLSLPSVVEGDCPGSSISPAILPGATEPDWGPADVQPRYEINADVARGTRLARALRTGLKLRVTTNAAGRLAGRVLVGRTRVATGAATLPSGTATITFRFTRQAQRTLARRGKVAFAVELTFTGAKGGSVPVTGTVTVRR